MNKISVVTGCAGFIGSHMTEFLLKKKHFVFGIDNLASGKIKNLKNFKTHNKFKFIKSDVKNFNNIIREKKIKKIDYFFHFAGHGELIPSIKNPLKYFENNSFKTAIVMDAIKNKFKLKKFIYAASSSCYGITNKKTKEGSKIKIEHPYAFSKYVGEQICLHWAKIYKIPMISIRIFNAYGPRSRTSNVYGAVIGVFLKQKLSNHPLTVIGNGKQKRDFLYISDLCEAFYKASISKYNHEIFNLGSSEPYSINYLASLISNNRKYISWRHGEPFKTEANIFKIKKYLKWKPKVSLKAGIETVKNDIYYWKNAPLWTKKKIYLATKLWNKLLKKKY